MQFQPGVMVSLMLVAFCLVPVGWQWMSAKNVFVRQHQTKLRWSTGLTAVMLVGMAQPGPAHLTQGSDINVAPYSIVEATALGNIKKSVVVSLDQRVSEDNLRALATRIKDSDPKQYQRTYIAFYLPGMKVGSGAWATAEFDPKLKVMIIGMTVDQEDAIKRLSGSPSRQVIGSWWDERPLLHNKMTFFREHGRVFMENKFEDGKPMVIEMREYSTPRGRKFVNKRDNGDFYLINATGDLEWWDEDGHFLTSRKAD